MIRLIALCLILLPSLSMADEARFSKAEVQANVLKFINTVFGANPPTIADRIRFGGRESMENDEYPLELDICRKKYKVPHPEREGCNEFLDSRNQYPQKFKSLYYELLRKKLAVTADMLKIESIHFVEGVPDKSAGYFLVTVDVENPNRHRSDPRSVHKQILLRHVDSQIQVPEGGTVSVQAVVMPIHEYAMPLTETETTPK
jgi:hypothetical protein